MAVGFNRSADHEDDLVTQTKELVRTEVALLEVTEKKLHNELKELQHLEENYKHVLVRFDSLQKMLNHRRSLMEDLLSEMARPNSTVDLQAVNKLVDLIEHLSLNIVKHSGVVYSNIQSLIKNEYHLFQMESEDEKNLVDHISADARKLSGKFNVLSAESQALQQTFEQIKSRVQSIKHSRNKQPLGLRR